MIYQPFAKGETKAFNFSMEYRINDYGVFVAYPTIKGIDFILQGVTLFFPTFNLYPTPIFKA
jgi:hypothetical protein